MKKIISIAILIVMIFTMLTACSQNEAQSPQALEVPEEPLTITDPAGNEIIVPEETNKIISMAPSITEVLVDLGFGDKIIAVDTNSKDLPGLPDDIPHIDMMAPDVEQLIALNPDIVLASTITMSGGSDPLTQLKDMGITLAYIPSSDSIEGIYSDLMFIAKVLNVEEEGQALVDAMKEKIEEIKEIGESITSRKSVYFEIAAAPDLYSFGKGVFLDEMIEIIGAENVLGNEEGWISVSGETIVAANPDVIITNVNYIENPVDEIKSRSGWENINAIKNDEVYYVDNMSSSLPNHNIIRALEEMAKAVYPDEY